MKIVLFFWCDATNSSTHTLDYRGTKLYLVARTTVQRNTRRPTNYFVWLRNKMKWPYMCSCCRRCRLRHRHHRRFIVLLRLLWLLLLERRLHPFIVYIYFISFVHVSSAACLPACRCLCCYAFFGSARCLFCHIVCIYICVIIHDLICALHSILVYIYRYWIYSIFHVVL